MRNIQVRLQHLRLLHISWHQLNTVLNIFSAEGILNKVLSTVHKTTWKNIKFWASNRQNSFTRTFENYFILNIFLMINQEICFENIFSTCSHVSHGVVNMKCRGLYCSLPLSSSFPGKINKLFVHCGLSPSNLKLLTIDFQTQLRRLVRRVFLNFVI